jgi:alkylation response protein AidB-like acyl-CoA dehydrogenase
MTGITLTPQPDDQAVIDSVTAVLRSEFALARLASSPGAADPGFWSRAAELGWPLAALDEALGGAGFDMVQEMLMNMEYGRFLAPASLLSTALGVRVLSQTGDGVTPEAVLSGRERIGFAAFTVGGRRGSELDGEVQLIDAAAAHFIVVDQAGAAVFSGDAVAGRTPVESLDPTVELARGRLEQAPARWLPNDVEAIALRAELLMAAQLTGAALAATDMAAEYAKVRVQFGKPIGSFQAVAHLCVDAAVKAAASKALLSVAAIALRDRWADADLQVSAAAQLAADAALLAATSNIQVHGAMGYSAESGAHLFLKRTMLWRRLLPLRPSAQTPLLRRSAAGAAIRVEPD